MRFLECTHIRRYGRTGAPDSQRRNLHWKNMRLDHSLLRDKCNKSRTAKSRLERRERLGKGKCVFLEALTLGMSRTCEPFANIVQRVVELRLPGALDRGVSSRAIDVNAQNQLIAKRAMKCRKLRKGHHDGASDAVIEGYQC